MHQTRMGPSPPSGFIPKVIYLRFRNRFPVVLSLSAWDIQASYFMPE